MPRCTVALRQCRVRHLGGRLGALEPRPQPGSRSSWTHTSGLPSGSAAPSDIWNHIICCGTSWERTRRAWLVRRPSRPAWIQLYDLELKGIEHEIENETIKLIYYNIIYYIIYYILYNTSDRRKFMLAQPFPRVNLQALRRSNFYVHSVWQAWDSQYSP